MLRNETKQILAEFEHKDWLDQYPRLNINLPWCGQNIPLTGMLPILDFFDTQVKGWDNMKKTIGEFEFSKSYFSVSLQQLINFLEANKAETKESCTTKWLELKKRLEVTEYQGYPIFTYDAQITTFTQSLAKENPAEARVAIDYLTSRDVNDSNVKLFNGLIRAFLFKNPGLEQLSARANEELKNLEEIRNTQFSKSQEYISFLARALADSEKEVNSYKASFANMKNKSEKDFTDWFESSRQKFTEFDATTIQRIKDFEKLYTDKLRMDAPAAFWASRANALKKQGNNFLIWLVVLVFAASLSIYLLLWKTPPDMLKSIFEEDKASAIRWSIVFIVFLSFIAYGIRVLAKVIFSSYHLARDAEEREHLTYVYLALKNDNAVEESDRSLILQSLFSRADTGLLKEDSSPTMPNGIDRLMSK